MEYVKTGCEALDSLLLGGIPLGKVTLIYGDKDKGKTWLSLQASVMCALPREEGGLGKKVIYIDTEEFIDEEVLERFFSYMSNRFNITPDVIKRIEFHTMEDVFKLWRFFGMQVTIQQSVSKTTVAILFPKRQSDKIQKSSTKDKDWLQHTPIWKKLSSGEYGLVVIDSFSAPIKDEFTSDQQNFPGRASLERPLLSACRSIAKKLNVAFLLTGHRTKGATSYTDEPWGGENIVYYVKRIIGIDTPPKYIREEIAKKYPDIPGEELRIFKRFRAPFAMKDMAIGWLKRDYGFTDLPSSRGGTL